MLGDKVHSYRATRRMSQQELADIVGVSRQTIIQLERNRYNPSMLLAYSIAKVFGVTIEDLPSYFLLNHRGTKGVRNQCE
ncbi:MAG: helix-turn-helix transcriptional regulator [Lachnospiraceae bacterium]|nr:helix-turn-helix transcriptional regulator [Lachnospiraceae bacterium]